MDTNDPEFKEMQKNSIFGGRSAETPDISDVSWLKGIIIPFFCLHSSMILTPLAVPLINVTFWWKQRQKAATQKGGHRSCYIHSLRGAGIA